MRGRSAIRGIHGASDASSPSRPQAFSGAGPGALASLTRAWPRAAKRKAQHVTRLNTNEAYEATTEEDLPKKGLGRRRLSSYSTSPKPEPGPRNKLGSPGPPYSQKKAHSGARLSADWERCCAVQSA